MTPVLIAGAGPTGLMLALWLTRLGVNVRIIDKAAEPGSTSRALGVQARTLEFYRQLGISAEVVAHGWQTTAVNFWVAGEHAARAPFGDMGRDITPFPFVLAYPQDEHERLLIAHLAQSGVQVERRTELIDFTETASTLTALLKRPDGSIERCEASWLAGCDGARSAVREKSHTGFPGGTYSHLFYVADVEASGPAVNGEVHVALDPSDILAIFPLKAEGRVRLVGTVHEDENRSELSWNDVSKRVIDWMRIGVTRVNWFSTYRVHHRVADHFRQGRAFLLGDAGHIHSPVGAQGMNTGIGDAVNLAWKLAAVLKGQSSESILDTYETERIAFARRLVETTDRAFTGATSRGPLVRWLRLDFFPMLVPRLFRSERVRRFLFRTVSQTAIHYRNSDLSEGHAGALHGGDRLPWAMVSDPLAEDNFAPLCSLGWQVHIYGEAAPELRALCDGRNLPIHIFNWKEDMSRNGPERNALYLVRPDGYIGLADSHASSGRLSQYLDSRALRFSS